MKKYLQKFWPQLLVTILAAISTVYELLRIFVFKGNWANHGWTTLFSVWWSFGFIWVSIPISKYCAKKFYLPVLLIWVAIYIAGLVFLAPHRHAS